LDLKPRTKPLEETTPTEQAAASKPKSNPFGAAKPRDENAIMQEIEERRKQRLEEERKQAEEEKKAAAEKRAADLKAKEEALIKARSQEEASQKEAAEVRKEATEVKKEATEDRKDKRRPSARTEEHQKSAADTEEKWTRGAKLAPPKESYKQREGGPASPRDYKRQNSDGQRRYPEGGERRPSKQQEGEERYRRPSNQQQQSQQQQHERRRPSHSGSGHNSASPHKKAEPTPKVASPDVKANVFDHLPAEDDGDGEWQQQTARRSSKK